MQLGIIQITLEEARDWADDARMVTNQENNLKEPSIINHLKQLILPHSPFPNALHYSTCNVWVAVYNHFTPGTITARPETLHHQQVSLESSKSTMVHQQPPR